MPPKKIRIAVAGLGRIGWKCHCREIAQHSPFELAAVHDTDPGRRREAETVYGVTAYASYAEMLRSADLEAVVVATPTHTHKDLAIEALRAGCHVLLEKPMAVTGKEAAEIVRVAKVEGRLLTVFQSMRAVAYFQHLRRIVASGFLGRVYHVSMGGYRYVRRDDWQSLSHYGGGVMLNAGSHFLDQLLQLIGYDVKQVFCYRSRVATLGDAEDVLKVVFETQTGVLGECEINQASTITPFSLLVWGTTGALEMSPAQDSFVVTRLRKSDLPPKKLNASLASRNRRYPFDDPWLWRKTILVDPDRTVDIYANLASAIRRGTPLFVKPEEPLAVMRLIDQCVRASGEIHDLESQARAGANRT